MMKRFMTILKTSPMTTAVLTKYRSDLVELFTWLKRMVRTRVVVWKTRRIRAKALRRRGIFFWDMIGCYIIIFLGFFVFFLFLKKMTQESFLGLSVRKKKRIFQSQIWTELLLSSIKKTRTIFSREQDKDHDFFRQHKLFLTLLYFIYFSFSLKTTVK